jgi:5-(carboxyamino)imidazole ribonucleotide synthase
MTADNGQIISPGGTIGILGGGQLGRMTAMAAARLGFRCHIFCPDKGAPASDVAAKTTVASYDDIGALTAFAQEVDVITFEFENVPSSAGDKLAALKPTRPDPRVLHLTQQRLREKNFLTSINVPVTRYLEVAHKEALPQAVQALGRPCVIKSASFGYDGKGQVRIDPETDLGSVWQSMGAELAILESYVDFQREISVVIARGFDGAMEMYVPVENQHRNHILDLTIAPARITPAIAVKAEAIARHIAQ